MEFSKERTVRWAALRRAEASARLEAEILREVEELLLSEEEEFADQ